MRSYVVTMKAATESSLPVSNGYILFSTLCRFVKGTQIDSVLHSGEEDRKSVSFGPLGKKTANPMATSADITLSKGESCEFRAAFLKDEDGEVFFSLIKQLTGESIRFGAGAELTFDGIFGPGEHKLALSATKENLTQPVPERIGFKFVSPTGFKRNGMQFFLPLPELIFGDLLRKWRKFIEDGAWPGLEEKFHCLDYLFYSIESRAVFLAEKRIYRGFFGNVQFAVNRISPEEIRAFASLARLAFFTGVGYKTTQGMGQTLPFFGKLSKNPEADFICT